MVLTVAIIGGGYAGAATAIHLIHEASEPLNICLIDSADHLARGVAYSTKNVNHPLNVRASSLGALENNPQGFYQWLTQNRHEWENQHPAYRNLVVTPDSYLPRNLYGLYLESVLEETKKIALTKDISFKYFHQFATDISLTPNESLKIALKNGNEVFADAVVLATGAPPYKKFSFESFDNRYIGNLWAPQTEQKLREALASSNVHSKVCLIGTGLTMVDALWSLQTCGFKGEIHAFSTHGKLPEAHFVHPSAKVEIRLEDLLYKSPLALIKLLRTRISEGKEDWRSYIDALRPHLPTIWKGFSNEEKRRFMRHVFSHWNKLRHRMSPESAELISELKKNKRLHLWAGKIEAVDASSSESLKVYYCKRGQSAVHMMKAALFINAAGPELRITKQDNHLLRRLIDKGLVKTDALGIGLGTSPRGDVQGNVSDKFYTLGATLFGERFETTAVPEIRQQADKLAKRLVRAHFFSG